MKSCAAGKANGNDENFREIYIKMKTIQYDTFHKIIGYGLG
jgi:hypothetical protein